MPCCSFSKEGALPISCVWLGVQLRDSSALDIPSDCDRFLPPSGSSRRKCMPAAQLFWCKPHIWAWCHCPCKAEMLICMMHFLLLWEIKATKGLVTYKKKPTDKKSSRTTWLVLWASYFHLEVFIFRATEKQVVSNLWSPDTALLPKGSPNHAG